VSQDEEPLVLNIRSKFVDPNYEALNFGLSKGLGFDHVIIYPANDMAKWMLDQNIELAETTRAQFYVAITRARYSVAVFRDFKNNEIMDGFSIFE
jgi:DNA helicase IV